MCIRDRLSAAAANSNKRATIQEEEVSIAAITPPTVTVVHSASPRRPRTIVCYICSKQFGTASFHLHEPQCIQVRNTFYKQFSYHLSELRGFIVILKLKTVLDNCKDIVMWNIYVDSYFMQ